MTGNSEDDGPGPDTGLLSPVRAGGTAERSTDDRAWLRALLDAEAALVRAQARLGAAPAAAAETVTRVAAEWAVDPARLAVRSRESGNPVVALVEDLTAAVAAVDAGAADHVHRGSTSQDMMDTAAMLVAARTLALIQADLDRTASALARLAGDHRDTVMVGRTLTQHAVPSTFGLKAAGWLHSVVAAGERLRRVRADLPAQLGGAAGTLSAYLEYARIAGAPDPDAYPERLMAAFAAEVGLKAPVLPWHTSRIPIADLAGVLTLTAGVLGKIAVDVQVLSRTEIAEVAEPSAAGRGGSSAMPHKRNPVLATLVRSAAIQVPMLAATLGQCMLAEDERPAGAWQAEWQPLRECLRLVGGAAEATAELTEGLRVFPDRMRANLELTGSLTVTERVAAVLAPILGKAAAKRIVGRAAADAVATGRPIADLLAEIPAVSERLTREDIADLVDPAAYTGVAGTLVDRALRAHEPGDG
ncbi:adenylosuccinate lyase family protein [Planotetraspora phitsanulokensis]|uniref:3-carboxy-cis,cis-muconate cycloisomerase n=1 Tax=Planotetraspora phitsanulokensis TaxID=575192 RepID=A0A8J3U5U2_9ACTN|nr:3-carboxy-cis,cis-muconate cycloisomerase [Planotetraspora phitsanulokensis]GII39128.1 3-carboxy-cis,cis-muconate cycloisomerase [Planotetraspora phitsanulokensis]